MAIYSVPDFSSNNTNRVEQFEETCVKKIHSTVMPGVPFKQLEIEPPYLLSKYQEKVAIAGLDWPTIQFDNSSNYYSVNFKRLFTQKLSTFSFWKNWQKEDYQQYVFPMVSTPMLITKFDMADIHCLSEQPTTYIIKSDERKDPTDYIIIKLTDWYRYVLGEDSCRLI